MAAPGTGSSRFIDGITHDGSSRMNSELYINTLLYSNTVTIQYINADLEELHHANTLVNGGTTPPKTIN